MTDTLASAFLAAQSEMPNPGLTGSNPHYGSKFVPRDEVLSTVKPVLNKHGIALIQHMTGDGMVTVLHGHGESWSFGPWPVRPSKPDPQGEMAAATYASRGALMHIFALAGDVDDDGNAASEKPEPELSEAEVIIAEAKFFGSGAALLRALELKKGASKKQIIDKWDALDEDARKGIRFIVKTGAEEIKP